MPTYSVYINEKEVKALRERYPKFSTATAIRQAVKNDIETKTKNVKNR